ncbi:hypothetical protein [Actinoplanes aureus]|uniref:Uncharacterized protein n=1 Tax=Actinoplanes aureus TaxID=2792083 RepID=A0A931FZS2_9ACTN|nr:hypothetical protein [Actinoplanes aureus]MBG0560699.1 hypothetical protein [Actinoplanes aureus]
MADLRVHTVPVQPCCGLVPGECECLSPEAAAAEMASLLRERPPIVMRTGPAAQAAMAQADATHPLLIAMRAAATTRFDSEGQPR